MFWGRKLKLRLFLLTYSVEMEIKSFNAVVNLEFLLVLSKVFTSALATDESDSTLLLASKHVSQKVAITHPSVTVANTDEEPPQIVVQIAIKDPEIILLADGRDKNTNALFLKVSTNPTVHSWPDRDGSSHPINPLHYQCKHQYAYSPYCSLYISLGAHEENMFNNQEFL